jgi:hypothetical protein
MLVVGWRWGVVVVGVGVVLEAGREHLDLAVFQPDILTHL